MKYNLKKECNPFLPGDCYYPSYEDIKEFLDKGLNEPVVEPVYVVFKSSIVVHNGKRVIHGHSNE